MGKLLGWEKAGDGNFFAGGIEFVENLPQLYPDAVIVGDEVDVVNEQCRGVFELFGKLRQFFCRVIARIELIDILK